MEPLSSRSIGYDAGRTGAMATGERARELAEAELYAAIAFVARDHSYRVDVCETAMSPGLVTELDELAASVGVVLERRIRLGGGLDVVVRFA